MFVFLVLYLSVYVCVCVVEWMRECICKFSESNTSEYNEFPNHCHLHCDLLYQAEALAGSVTETNPKHWMGLSCKQN